MRRKLLKFLALLAVVALTFVKIFPFSSHLFGSVGALAFGTSAGDGRLQRWFSLRDGVLNIFAWGIVGGLAVFAADAVLFSLFPLLGIAPEKLERFAAVKGNLSELVQWLLLIWFVVGITEELISRAFLIDQWGDILPAGRRALVLSVLLSSVTFAAVHYYEGVAGLISNFVAGMILGALYVMRGRTLGSNVVAHAVADSLGLIAIYLGLAS